MASRRRLCAALVVLLAGSASAGCVSAVPPEEPGATPAAVAGGPAEEDWETGFRRTSQLVGHGMDAHLRFLAAAVAEEEPEELVLLAGRARGAFEQALRRARALPASTPEERRERAALEEALTDLVGAYHSYRVAVESDDVGRWVEADGAVARGQERVAALVAGRLPEALEEAGDLGAVVQRLLALRPALRRAQEADIRVAEALEGEPETLTELRRAAADAREAYRALERGYAEIPAPDSAELRTVLATATRGFALIRRGYSDLVAGIDDGELARVEAGDRRRLDGAALLVQAEKDLRRYATAARR